MSGVLDVGSVHQDALGSVVALSDANGALAASSIRLIHGPGIDWTAALGVSCSRLLGCERVQVPSSLDLKACQTSWSRSG